MVVSLYDDDSDDDGGVVDDDDDGTTDNNNATEEERLLRWWRGPPSGAARIANGRRDRARCKSSNAHAPESATTGVRGNGRSVLARSERRRRRATPETRGRERGRERDDDAGNGSGVFRRGYTREIEETHVFAERERHWFTPTK